MAVALSTIIFSPLSASPNSGATVTDTHTSVRVTATVVPELPSRTDPTVGAGTLRKTTSASESEVVSADVRGVRCKSARRGLEFYRGRQRDWLRLRWRTHNSLAFMSLSRAPRSCADARFLAQVAKRRSFAARQAHARWLERHTLRDFRVTPDSNAWQKAVQEAQKVFPATSSWLWNCSAAEGGHGRWVRFGGGSYYPGYEYTDAVGNWMQYRWSTFRGHYRRGLDDLRARGFRVPPHLRDPGDVRAWLSPLAVAIAAGWARWAGEDNSHWSASWGRGC